MAQWLLWAPAAMIFALFVALMDDRQSQITASSLLYGAANLLIAMSVLRGRPRHMLRARWLLAACYAVAGTTLVLRAWMAPDGFETALTANSYHGFLYLGTYALIVAGSFAFLLMHKERSDEESSRLATTDPLTGVFNRRTFIELAEQELARSRRARTPLALMMLDLDHFKRVHPARQGLRAPRRSRRALRWGRILRAAAGDDASRRHGTRRSHPRHMRGPGTDR
jgi:predicted signal transduction protein with EAL and GGDEF domain